VIGYAVKLMRLATGEEIEILAADDGKDPAAKALGKKDGAARAAKMTPERRQRSTKRRLTSDGERSEPL
jgi:hypothetical protein